MHAERRDGVAVLESVCYAIAVVQIQVDVQDGFHPFLRLVGSEEVG